MLKAAKHDAIKHAAEHARGVGDGLLLTQMDILAGETLGIAALVADGHGEGATRPCRELLEDQRNMFADQQVAPDARGTALFQIRRKLQQLQEFTIGQVA